MFDAVEALLEDEAYTEITIDSITAAAAISRSTLYAHFDDKASLLMALTEDIFQRADAAGTPWWDGPADVDRAELRERLQPIVSLYVEHKAVLRAFVDAAGYEPLVHAQLGQMHQRYIDHLEAHIRRGQELGAIRAAINPRPTAGWLIWMLERGLLQLVAPAEAGTETDDLADAAADIIWQTLYAL